MSAAFVEGKGTYSSREFLLTEEADPIALIGRWERIVRDVPSTRVFVHYARFRQNHPVGAAVHGATLVARLAADGDGAIYKAPLTLGEGASQVQVLKGVSLRVARRHRPLPHAGGSSASMSCSMRASLTRLASASSVTSRHRLG